jgi:molybdenum-dependent DNA-binding transcriptional regulator ModE
MATRKPGASDHTRYRHARASLADLEASRAVLERSRPRTRGKKAAKTRALNKLVHRIAAAKGQITKARNAIARAGAESKTTKSVAKQKRSEAAKKGWAKRKARRQLPAPAKPTGRMRFLEERDDEVNRIWVYPPDKADRSAIGSYWYAIGVYRDNGSTTLLSRFEGRTIYDERRELRLPFVTNLALLPEAIAAGLTDFDDLYSESSWASAP